MTYDPLVHLYIYGEETEHMVNATMDSFCTA